MKKKKKKNTRSIDSVSLIKAQRIRKRPEIRDKLFTLRVTDSELAYLHKKSKSQAISEWIRERIFT